MDEVKQIFRPEFLNRIDEIIVFHSLGKEEMKKIVSLLCNQFTKRLESQMNIHLKLRESAKALIVEKGTDAKYGARPLRRALQTELEDKLADAILNGEIQEGIMWQQEHPKGNSFCEDRILKSHRIVNVKNK